MKIYMNDIDTYLNEGSPWPGRRCPLPSLPPHPPSKKEEARNAATATTFCTRGYEQPRAISTRIEPGIWKLVKHSVLCRATA